MNEFDKKMVHLSAWALDTLRVLVYSSMFPIRQCAHSIARLNSRSSGVMLYPAPQHSPHGVNIPSGMVLSVPTKQNARL